MARLIYAKALTKRTDRYPSYISDTVRKELRYVPTVDAVEVLRCKDCKFYNANCPYPVCDYHEINVKETDFCSWGERREDETD